MRSFKSKLPSVSKNIKEFNDKNPSSSLESSFSSIEANERNTEIAHSKITINIDYTHDLKELIPPPNALLPHEISAIEFDKEILKIRSNVPLKNSKCSNKEVNKLNKENDKKSIIEEMSGFNCEFFLSLLTQQLYLVI